VFKARAQVMEEVQEGWIFIDYCAIEARLEIFHRAEGPIVWANPEKIAVLLNVTGPSAL
jgi:hypothetical protein